MAGMGMFPTRSVLRCFPVIIAKSFTFAAVILYARR